MKLLWYILDTWRRKAGLHADLKGNINCFIITWYFPDDKLEVPSRKCVSTRFHSVVIFGTSFLNVANMFFLSLSNDQIVHHNPCLTYLYFKIQSFDNFLTSLRHLFSFSFHFQQNMFLVLYFSLFFLILVLRIFVLALRIHGNRWNFLICKFFNCNDAIESGPFTPRKCLCETILSVLIKNNNHKLSHKQQFCILKQYKRVNVKVDKVLRTRALCNGIFINWF